MGVGGRVAAELAGVDDAFSGKCTDMKNNLSLQCT